MGIGWKGFTPDRKLNHTIVCVSLIAVLYCLIGLASGYISASSDGTKQLKPFEWDTERILYAIFGALFCGVGYLFAGKYTDYRTKWGARVLIAMPVALVLILVILHYD